MVLLYVVHNAVGVVLLSTVAEWPWSSLQTPQLADPWSLGDEREAVESLDTLMRDDPLIELRKCVNRQRPFGKSGLASGNGVDVWTCQHVASARPTAERALDRNPLPDILERR